MGYFATNDTVGIFSEAGDHSLKPFTRSETIIAAVCAIIFSIIGVLGNVLYLPIVLQRLLIFNNELNILYLNSR